MRQTDVLAAQCHAAICVVNCVCMSVYISARYGISCMLLSVDTDSYVLLSWGAQVIEVENPNAQQKSAKNMKIKDMDAAAEPAPLSRRVSIHALLTYATSSSLCNTHFY
jgi:hypothetical protein